VPPERGRPADAAPDWAALARVWAGEPGAAALGEADAAADAEADAEARRWLAAHPDEAARLAALDRITTDVVAPAPADAPPVDVEAALARVTRRRLADPPAVPAPARRPAPAWAARSAAPRWSRPRLAGAGAAAALLLAAGITLARRQPTVAVAQRHTTAVGQRDSVRLADGTRVLLGPASTLRVPAEYGRATRTVTLDGEAYFDVVHDSARPFAVVAGPAVVRDLGTAFAVRTDDADHVAVAVTQGAVHLAAAPATPGAQPPAAGQPPRRPAIDSGLVLRASERGMVARDARRGLAVSRLPGPAARAADDTAWTSGRLVFRDAPLTEVAGALRRWYGVEMRVTDPALAARHLTANFRGEPLPAVLRVVGLALGARLDQQGDTVFVRAPR
jgi:transmembrane sensor